MRRVRNKDERALAVHSTQGPKSPTSLNVDVDLCSSCPVKHSSYVVGERDIQSCRKDHVVAL